MVFLRKHGIMGINQRNLDFIAPYNDRKNYPNADSKLAIKALAESVGVAAPKLIASCSAQHEVSSLVETLREVKRAVIKPDHGSGGGGIVVITDYLPVGFQKASGDILRGGDLRFHCQNILSGKYSLGNQPDTILLEAIVAFDPIFDEIAFRGVPDIRIIVLQGKPIQAMLRLPTQASDGKANLHKGGIGVGIDMARGVTTHAVQHNRYIQHHSETGQPLAGHTIPHWQAMKQIAVKMQRVSELGYIGVDIVLDKDQGPMVLEINVRPGISIQIANRQGLNQAIAAAA